MKKLSIGIIIGIISIISVGMTYEITYGVFRENVVDVRVVEVGGHEYVIASSYIPSKSLPEQNFSKESKVGINYVSKTIVTPTSSNLCMMHHVGCKACKKEGNN